MRPIIENKLSKLPQVIKTVIVGLKPTIMQEKLICDESEKKF